jgi:hypothetical protein
MTTSLARELALALDPVAFSRAAAVEPDRWQARLLRSTAPRVLVNCARQSGKSSTVATISVHTAVYTPGSVTLLLSPTLRQSSELFKKCLAVYRALGRPVDAAAETALTLSLEHGSRIVSLPGKEGTIRGYSGITLLIVDEASRVSDDLYVSVRPMLAVSGGRLIALSTPFGTRGWWWEAWRGSEAWERYEVKATDCPRITPEFLAEERRTIGDYWFQQEYMCRFLDSRSSAFRSADVEASFQEYQRWPLRQYISASTSARSTTPPPSS